MLNQRQKLPEERGQWNTGCPRAVGPMFVLLSFPACEFCSLVQACRAHGRASGSTLGDPEKHCFSINLSDFACPISQGLQEEGQRNMGHWGKGWWCKDEKMCLQGCNHTQDSLVNSWWKPGRNTEKTMCQKIAGNSWNCSQVHDALEIEWKQLHRLKLCEWFKI